MAKKKSASSQQEKRVAASALFTKPLTDRQRGELDRLANLPETRIDFSDAAEATHPNSGERVRDVYFTEDTLAVDLLDGRTIIVPLTWYPRLLDATAEQRSRWKISGAGYGIHWPDIDEDLSTDGLLRGAPAAAEPAPLRR